MQHRLLPCFFPDGVEQPPKQLFPSMRRSNWNPYKWNPFGWGSGGFSSFQFCRNNNHCVIIFMLLLCRAVRQAEIPHNMWKTEQRSRCRWSDGEDIACFITLAQLPACNASAVSHVTILVSVLLAGADSHTHTHTQTDTHCTQTHKVALKSYFCAISHYTVGVKQSLVGDSGDNCCMTISSNKNHSPCLL